MHTKEIQLNNRQIEKQLTDLKDEFFELREKYGAKEGESKELGEWQVDPEWYCSEEYLWHIKEENGDNHIGFPETYYSINLPQLKRERPDQWADYVYRVKNDMAVTLGAHTSALALMYPPGGFVGWHTNWNCPSYQILFTWSETGDGYFKFVDPATNEIVTLQDEPGWNVRYHYFGSKKEPNHALWHSAYTDCDRFSFSYKYVTPGWNQAGDSIVQELVMDTLEEICHET